MGLPLEWGFWARVCKAIFLCGGKGKQGMNWVWGEGEKRLRGKEGGASPLEHSYWSRQQRHTCVHNAHSVHAPSPAAWPHPASRDPFQDHREGLGVQL